MFKDGPLRAVGAMSGTSLDGVDAAEVITDGVTITSFGESHYRPYSAPEQSQLRAALGLWQDADLAEVSELIETAHAQVLSLFDIPDLFGFHGQTLAHDPASKGTHQCGDGAVLAEVLGAPVVWDFRSADVRFGGQGAPLAPFFHFALAKYIRGDKPLAFLNLGGVGNLTWVNPTANSPDDPDALIAFDTGPANAPINDLMQSRLGKVFDEDGVLAAKGTVNDTLVEDFLRHPYFFKIPPKSLDRDAFQSATAAVTALTDPDATATLCAMSAMSVLIGLDHVAHPPNRILVTGGGRKNPTLMSMIAEGADCPVGPVEDVDLDGDMLEAQAFAYLAVRVARGLPTSSPTTTGVSAAVSGGTISRPQNDT